MSYDGNVLRRHTSVNFKPNQSISPNTCPGFTSSSTFPDWNPKMAQQPITPPPYDLQLASFLAENGHAFVDLTSPDQLQDARATVYEMTYPLEKALRSNPAIAFEERVIPGPRGTIPILTLRSAKPNDSARNPGIVYYHAGGRVMGGTFGLSQVSGFVESLNAVVVSVDYRLAPENPGSAGVEDCYTALKWVAENADELGINLKNLMVAGTSAGGGLAAGVALMARDRSGPQLCGQLLISPMLDDRNTTVSSRQFTTGGSLTSIMNATVWKMVLGDKAGTDDVSPYVVPTRARDFAGLPPTYLDSGSAECFRDEIVEYASKLWEYGVAAELHIWAGGFHGSDMVVPTADVSVSAVSSRDAWVRRLLKIEQQWPTYTNRIVGRGG